VTPAQEEAIARAAAATEPVKINAGTARILSDRYGYIAPEGDGWVLTPQGRMYLAGKRAEERYREVVLKLTPADRRWAKRVIAWMEAHKRIRDWDYAHKSHAEHVAACDHAGLEPVSIRQWADGSRRRRRRLLRSRRESAPLSPRGSRRRVERLGHQPQPLPRASPPAGGCRMSVIDLSLTTRSDEELRRLAADGNQDAVAEMARRNRRQINLQRARPSRRGGGNPSQRRPDVGFVSTGRKVNAGGGSSEISAGRQVA